MNEQLLRSRFRELFPKAQNLNKKRLDVFVSKLSAKLSEESTQEDIDALWKDYNDVVNFEQLSKDDHRLTSLSLKEKEPKEEIVTKIEGKEIVKEEQENVPEWAKALLTEVKTLREEKVQDTIQSKFRNHEALKGIPTEILDLVKSPTTLDEVDQFATTIADVYKEKQIKEKLDSFGRDIPPQGEHSKNVEVKQASDKEVDDVFKNLGL